MYKHPNSPEFIRYLKTVVPDLVKAIEDHLWTLWKAGDITPNGYHCIAHDLWLIGGHFSFLNNNITEREAAFIYDIQSFLGVNDFDNDSTRLLREIMLMPHNVYLYEDFDSLEYPGTVNYIKVYKSIELRKLQTKSKEMLIRYASAVCLAENGKMSDIQFRSLSNYQAVLDENF